MAAAPPAATGPGDDPVIRLAGVDKVYRLYAHPRDRMKEALHPFRKKYHKDFYALRGVDLAIGRGESVGIVGRNGSGKSTLLKTICGVLTPTAGSCSVHGRISALLELGAGFNPDFTGLENIHFQCSIMGFQRAEIESLVPAILEFADIGDFANQPVRSYSSGMFVRLAFAVAISVDPEILVVDEALAVGDAYFQAKCIARIREFQAGGRTLLFVSHDPAAVMALCDRACLLDQGLIVESGSPDTVFDVYNAMLAPALDSSRFKKDIDGKTGKTRISSGSGEAKVTKIIITDSKGRELEKVRVGQAVRLVIVVQVTGRIPSLVLGYMIKNRLGQPVFGTNTWHTGQIIENALAGESYRFTVEFEANLGEGDYSVSTALTGDETHLGRNYEWKDLGFVFGVARAGEPVFVGGTWLPPKIGVERIDRTISETGDALPVGSDVDETGRKPAEGA